MNTKQLTKSFPITSVCREDILSEKYPRKFVESLNDWDMKHIAEKMADAFCETDVYWIALHTICDELLKNKK